MMVGAGLDRGMAMYARAAPAACWLSGLTRSVSRVCKLGWAGPRAARVGVWLEDSCFSLPPRSRPTAPSSLGCGSTDLFCPREGV